MTTPTPRQALSDLLSKLPRCEAKRRLDFTSAMPEGCQRIAVATAADYRHEAPICAQCAIIAGQDADPTWKLDIYERLPFAAAVEAAERALATSDERPTVTISLEAIPERLRGRTDIIYCYTYSITVGDVTVDNVHADELDGWERVAEALGARVVRRPAFELAESRREGKVE